MSVPFTINDLLLVLVRLRCRCADTLVVVSVAEVGHAWTTQTGDDDKSVVERRRRKKRIGRIPMVEVIFVVDDGIVIVLF